MTKVTFVVSWVDDTLELEYLKRCLESLRQQNEIDCEIFLLSNFENEGVISEQVKAWLTEGIHYENYSGLTVGQLKNQALSKATGEYICFVRSQDFLVEDSIATLFKQVGEGTNDILIGQVMVYDAKLKTLATKEVAKEFDGHPLKMTMETGMINPELLKDLDLANKLFRVEFLKQNQITFSETHYDHTCLFQLKALVQAQSVSTVLVHFYNERLLSGLEKLEHPTLEETIDEKQVTDQIQVFFESDQWSETVGIECVQQFLIHRYLDFVFKRGLNYLNISSTPEVIFEQLARPLADIDVMSLKRSGRQKRILTLLKENEYALYREFIANEKALKTKKKSLPKHIKRQLFIQLYELGRKFPIKKRQVLFVSHSPGMDGNYSFIQRAIEDYNQTVKRSERFSYQMTSTKISAFQKLFLPLKLSRSEFILAAEYIPFFQLLDFREETKVVQTWHAAGAFKKFGYSTNYLPGGPNPFKNQKMHLHRGYDYATVSSEEVRRHYAEAFEMEIEKVLPIGFPRADFFYDQEAVKQTQNKLYDLYPMLKGKQVILYAPTFRGVGKKRANFKMEFDVNRIAREISDDYMIALKLHPSVKSSDIIIDPDVENKIVDLSPYKEANDVLTITDLLITDYSSIIFDYSLLKKPMLFYAYDLDEYRFDRDFYYEYETFVPGPIAQTNEEIIRLINQWEFDLERVQQFSETFFVSQTGDHSKRFVEDVLVKLSQTSSI